MGIFRRLRSRRSSSYLDEDSSNRSILSLPSPRFKSKGSYRDDAEKTSSPRHSRLPNMGIEPIRLTSTPTLLEVLTPKANTPCSRLFEQFCRESFADESISFWRGVEQLKQMQGSQDYAETIDLVQTLLREYIIDESPRQVNLSSSCREKLLERCAELFSMKLLEAQKSFPTVFNEAQHDIELLIQRGLFPRFCDDVSTKM